MWQPIETAPDAQASGDLAEAIIADMQAQYNSELITENDSGEALIRLDGAIAAVEDNFAQAQPAPSVPECPYPCGWRNLLKYAIEDGAYLARSINEDEPVTENARAVTMRTVMRLRDVLMAINNATPEAKP